MSLVTLAQAKAHLRVTTSDSDDDILLKLDQATGIILDYLKGRAHETAGTTVVITTSSVASPTVITTESPHTFLAASSVVISGHLGSVPDVNRSHVISNVTASSFTIPVVVTTAGTGGVASLAWVEDTVPWPVHAATLLMLTHLYEHRGDEMATDDATWQAIERLLCRLRDPVLA